MLYFLLLIIKVFGGTDEKSEQIDAEYSFDNFVVKTLQYKLPELPLLTKIGGSIFDTAYYYFDLVIGAPENQVQSMIIDTGSSTQGFPCSSCNYCGKTHWEEPYDLTKSKYIMKKPCKDCDLCRLNLNRSLFDSLITNEIMSGNVSLNNTSELQKIFLNDGNYMQCMYDVSYAEGSKIVGLFFNDIMWLNTNNNHIVSASKDDKDYKCIQTFKKRGPSVPIMITIGCHIQETHLFKDQKASGILGMEFWSSKGSLSFTRELLDKLKLLYTNQQYKQLKSCDSKNKKQEFSYMFSLCFSNNGGSLGFGQHQWNSHVPNAVTNYIPLIVQKNKQKSYTVGLETIEITAIGKLSQKAQSKEYFELVKSKKGWVQIPLDSNSYIIENDKSQYKRRPITPALFDSGTTLSYFGSQVFKKLLKAIEIRVSGNGRNLLRNSRADLNIKYVQNTTLPSELFATDEGPAIIHERFMSKRDRKDRNRVTFIPVSNRTLLDSPKRLIKLSSIPYTGVEQELSEEIKREIILKLGTDRRVLEEDDSNWYAVVESSLDENNLNDDDNENAKHILIGFVDIPKFMEGATLRKLVNKIEGYNNGDCWWLQNGLEDLALFPTLRFKFYGMQNYIAWHPQTYMYNGRNDRFWCLTIMANALGPEDNYKNEAILGSNSFIDKEIGFHLNENIITHNDDTLIDFDEDDNIYYILDSAWISITEAKCPNTNIKKRF